MKTKVRMRKDMFLSNYTHSDPEHYKEYSEYSEKNGNYGKLEKKDT